MKKLFLLASGLVSYCLSAQNAGSLFIQNYTPHYVGYVIWKSNMGSPATGCTPVLEARNIQNDLIQLAPAINAATPTEANYESNVNLGFSPHPVYTSTPLIGRVNVNSNFNPPYNTAPTPIIATFSNLTTWTGMKIGISNTSGVAIGGYYFMGETCGSTTVVPDLSAYPNAVVGGSYFTFGGATWAVFF